MPRNFLRALLPGHKRRAPTSTPQASAPTSPVPLPIGGNRAASGAARTSGPTGMSNLQPWSPTRPSARTPGPSASAPGPLLGQARTRPRATGTAPPPLATGFYGYVGSESAGTEDETVVYQDDIEDTAPQQQQAQQQAPAIGFYGYVGSESAETEDETVVYQDDIEDTAPQQQTQQQAPAIGFYGYVGSESAETEAEDDPYQNDIGPLAPSSSRVVEQIRAETSAVDSPGARSGQSGPTAPQAPRRAKLPKPPADLPAVREHRSWFVKHLLGLYDHEKDVQSPHLLEQVDKLGGYIAKYYLLLGSMRALSPEDQQGLSDLLQEYPADSATRQSTSYADALVNAEAHYARLLEKARREELPISETGEVEDLSTRFVEYDETPEAQARTTVKVGGGRLYRADGSTPVETAASVTHHTGLGAEIFVVDDRNEIHMASHKIGKYHHSSLLGGKPVSMAGEMQVTHGTIDWLSNKSGHYAPTLVQLQQFLRHLEKDHVPMNFQVRSMSRIPDLPATVTAREVLDGVTVDGTPDKERSLEAVKTQTLLPAWIATVGRPAIKKFARDHGWKLDEALGEPEITMPDGELADPRAVRKALKATFPGIEPRIVMGRRP